MSDLHLEFTQGKFDFMVESPDDSETVLILAGDIGIAVLPNTYIDFIKYCCERYREVIMIMGNHEHYKGNISLTYHTIDFETCQIENFSLLENETIVIDRTLFVCCTLWTNMNNNDPICILDAGSYMNDYREIGKGTSHVKMRLIPQDTINIHNESKQMIFDELSKFEGNKVVVTHHCPSFQSIHDRLKTNKLNGAYATELSNDILTASPNLWIHGHSHTSQDYMIGDTRIVSNPRGYVTYDPCDLNSEFDPNLIIEI